jgi:steroid delta-isomerase-like uncharacterized protein
MLDSRFALPQDLKLPVRRYFAEALDGRNFGVIQELFAPDYRDHDNANLDQKRGADGEQEHVSGFLAAFPDARFTIDEMVAERDLVVTRWHAEGTHTGPLPGLAPTGKRLHWHGMMMHRIEHGRIAEGWSVWDAQNFFRQLNTE